MTPLAELMIFLVGCIATEAFFSGSEIAFLSANRAKVLRRAKDKVPGAELARHLLSHPEALFSTTVVGTTLAINASTTLATLYIIRRFGYGHEWLNLLLLTPLILIGGEFVPKMIGRSQPENAVCRVSRTLVIARFVLYPLTSLLSLYSRVLKKVLGESPERGFFLSREEIKGALPASRGTDVTAAERQLVERILDFSRITVKEMRRPLIDVVGVEEDCSLEEAVRLLAESRHARLPVYRERVDRIVGVLAGFDCLRAPDLDRPVSSVMKPALFIPESKPVEELLTELREHPMAIAVNEFGGAEGIITLEDVMEEIVGEIEDEYDEPPRFFQQIGPATYLVNARMEIDNLRELLRIPIPPDDDYQTLAGFLLKRMQTIPKKWDSTVIDGVKYVIQSATDRSIEEVCVILDAQKGK
jgi:CBS domain containing-hemolysin-like protein